MSSSSSSTTSTTITNYNPTDDTINTITTGLLPLFLFGLYKGFENDKKRSFSPINIFDDFIIFASIIIFPLITVIKWYPYFSDDLKIVFITEYIFMTAGGLISYIIYYKYYYYYYENNEKNSRKKFKSQFFICIISILLILSSFLGYDMIISGDIIISDGDDDGGLDHISDFCENSFTYDKCNDLRISNYTIYGICLGVNFTSLFLYLLINIGEYGRNNNKQNETNKSNKRDKFEYWSIKQFSIILDKLNEKKLRILGTVCNHLVMIILVIYPAIVSGWLLSTDSVTTKIAFGICSISLSRLVEHFNDDEPETIISHYLNQHRWWKDKKSAEKIKELGKDMIEQIQKQTEKTRQAEERKELMMEIRKLAKEMREKANEIEEKQTEMKMEEEEPRSEIGIKVYEDGKENRH